MYIVDVLLIGSSKFTSRRYTYLSNIDIKIGQRVTIPFGKGNKNNFGLVVNIEKYTEEELSKRNLDRESLKYIIDIIDEEQLFTEKSMELAKWISKQTMSSEIEAMELFFPKGEDVNFKSEKIIILKDEEKAQKYIEKLRANAKTSKSVTEKIIAEKEIHLKEITKEYGDSSRNIIRKLREENIIDIFEKKIKTEIKSIFNIDNKIVKFTDEQQYALEKISKSDKPILLFGVTGSGKTEVYMQSIKKEIEEGKEAIVLVPEISLTPQTIGRFKNIFGNHIAVMHSGLSKTEKKEQWEKMKSGEAKLVIGPRSALFAPFKNIGIIVIDECHEDSYKSDTNPKYDTIEVALKMAEIYKTKLILGSATPTVDQMIMAKEKKLELVKLSHRAGNAQMPKIEIIDMLKEKKYGNRSILSTKLIREIDTALKENNQIMLFLNRRGFANLIRCENCGYIKKCKNCDISLVYHKNSNKMVCHYCGYSEEYDNICPECHEKMYNMGIGTQQVEEEIKKIFPKAKISRMDKDTTKEKGSYEKILEDFKNKNTDILIGTQMISKGHDFPNTTLVGIINADETLKFPDYRSTERTFALISQVAGRCGRGDKEGKAIIQSYEPDNPVYQYIINNEYEEFIKNENFIRKQYEYPPYSNIIRIICSSQNEISAGESVQKLKDGIQYLLKKSNINISILGPNPCMISKIDNKYRWQIMMKISDDKKLEKTKEIIQYLTTIKRSIMINKDVIVNINLNPKNMI